MCLQQSILLYKDIFKDIIALGISTSLIIEREYSLLKSNSPNFPKKKKSLVRLLFRSYYYNIGNNAFHLMLLTFPMKKNLHFVIPSEHILTMKIIEQP